VIGSGKPFLKGESQLNRTYQIEKEHAVQKFRTQAAASGQEIQIALALPEVLRLVHQGLMQLARVAFSQVAEEMMRWEVGELAGRKHTADPQREKSRWGTQKGYCVLGGQKLPLQRPRLRDTRQREVPLGSYEMLRRSSMMDDSVWHKIMHGLTTRRYSEVVRELQQAYGWRSRQ
jgi:putative transposase